MSDVKEWKRVPYTDQQSLIDADRSDQPDKPVCDLYGWTRLSHGGLWAARFKNHPRLGDGEDIRTTACLFFSQELKMAITLNTIYRLHDEAA